MTASYNPKENFIDPAEIKPCPFCGGDAVLSPVTHRSKTMSEKGCTQNYAVKCVNECLGINNPITTYETNKLKAIETWNNRADEAKVKELEADLKQAHKQTRAALDDYHDMKEENERYKAVLEFYKNINIYLADFVPNKSRPYFDFRNTPIHKDSGEIAREALHPTEDK